MALGNGSRPVFQVAVQETLESFGLQGTGETKQGKKEPEVWWTGHCFHPDKEFGELCSGNMVENYQPNTCSMGILLNEKICVPSPVTSLTFVKPFYFIFLIF